MNLLTQAWLNEIFQGKGVERYGCGFGPLREGLSDGERSSRNGATWHAKRKILFDKDRHQIENCYLPLTEFYRDQKH